MIDSSFSFFRQNSREERGVASVPSHLQLAAAVTDTHLLADLSIDEDDVVQRQDEFGDAFCPSVLPGDTMSSGFTITNNYVWSRARTSPKPVEKSSNQQAQQQEDEEQGGGVQACR